MAAPMRSSSQEAGHRPRVADTRSTTSSSSNTTAKQDSQTSTTTTTTTTTTSTAAATATPATATNFEYDDNEWDIGIGDLIIDLDADIEKTNEAGTVMATNAATAGSAKAAAKMAIEHSATVDKGLKMKIKRTKPGTKTSEAKHEIVKSNEQNGVADAADVKAAGVNKHLGQNADKKYGCVATTPGANAATPTQNCSGPNTSATTPTPSAAATNNKRGSSGHRRDKAREKHSSSSSSSSSSTDKQLPTSTQPPTQPTLQQPPSSPKVASPVTVSELNGVVRGGVVPSQTAGLQRPVYPASTGPGPPQGTQGTPASPAAATGSAAKPEIAKGSAGGTGQGAAAVGGGDDGSAGSPPPAKKIKSEPKDVADVCVGTSVGTITEPDCLGPCEPGTSVTLEGIVWHETEGGVLVVNVTWRGKTYVGTLLDCTRHDWAPPRFCDSPTSDLDTRTPKGRETRSSVHSKLRNGGIKGRRGATNNGPGPSTGPSSPTPFVPPRSTDTTGNKRKVRTGEEEQPSPAANGKKTKVLTPVATPCASPPPSPVLLECPEPNCSKKYKHINGLKYHQSHAHGSADDEDTKDVTSMSENDESNIEAPSPATPVKSPEKSQDSPAPVKKREEAEMPLLLRGSALLEVPGNGSQPSTPVSTPPSPATPQSLLQDISGSPTVATVDSKNLVKPGILRYGTSNEEFPIGVFAGSKPQVQPTVVTPEPAPQPEPSFTNQLQSQIPQQFTQPPTLLIPAQSAPAPQPLSPLGAQSPKFKVKPAAALMPDDKKDRNGKVVGGFKKNKSRKSPGGSPNPPQAEQAVFGGIEQPQGGGRDEVQSPAYSDISDDGAPVVMDGDLEGKVKVGDKKGGDGMQHMPQYGIYPFYGQSPYLEKQEKQVVEKPVEKEGKKEDYPGKMMQHYVPYGYMSGYAYNLDYGSQLVEDSKVKEERGKEDASSSPGGEHVKAITPIPNPIQVPTPNKIIKTEKDKHQNENHQILKESIEMKNQMNNYMYQRQQQQQSHLSQREEDVRRFYVYSERRKEQQQQQQQQQNQENNKNHNSNKNPPPQSPNLKHKEKLEEKDKKDNIKQEGVKPTMETQGPPPPPTSQYAYIHPTYMQSPHYGPLPFDPNHPMYRGIMVPGPYSGNPYLHPQLPRYHAPEDLSRAPPPPTKALDMLQHHAQYYSSHKIHELQERALKSPTPKTSIASSSPSAVPGTQTGQVVTQLSAATSQANSTTATGGGKQTAGETKDNRSPPPQRHVHTHHHTHVGLGYPMYPAPYGAAVLASQQAAAVTVINPYPPK